MCVLKGSLRRDETETILSSDNMHLNTTFRNRKSEAQYELIRELDTIYFQTLKGDFLSGRGPQ